MSDVRTRVVRSFLDVDARGWDALVASADNPFLEHAFLRLLENPPT